MLSTKFCFKIFQCKFKIKGNEIELKVLFLAPEEDSDAENNSISEFNYPYLNDPELNDSYDNNNTNNKLNNNTSGVSASVDQPDNASINSSKTKKQTYLDDDRVSSKETVKLLDNQSEAASLGGQNLKSKNASTSQH